MDIFAGTIDGGTQLSKELWAYKVKLDPAVTWTPGAHVHIGLPGFRDGDTPNKALVRHMSAASLTDDGYLEFITRVPAEPSLFNRRFVACTKVMALASLKLVRCFT